MSTVRAVRDREAPRRRSALHLGLVLVAVAIAFLPVLHAGFFWDDRPYVVENPALRTMDRAALHVVLTRPLVGHYHPLTVLSLAADHALWGLDPRGYHVTNLLLHLGNVALVFLLVRRFAKEPLVAPVAALLWGIHPLRVEPVAWIASRKDLLSTVFLLAAWIAYERWASRSDRRAYASAIGLHLAALLAKASAVVLALLLPVGDLVARRSWTRRRWVDKVPFWALAAIFGGVALWAALGSGSRPSDEGHGLAARLLYPTYALAVYLAKTVWPVGLSADYPFPRPGTPLPTAALLAPFALAALAGFVVASWRWTRKPACAFLVFLLALVVVLRPVGGALLAERYTYVPSIGLAWLAAEGWVWLWGRGRAAALTILLVAAGLLGVATWNRCRVWTDETTLWTDVIAKHPDSWIAWHGRAVQRESAGDPAGALRDLDEAIRLDPGAALSFLARANAKVELGDPAGALADYDEAIRLDPGAAQPRYNKGYLLLESGDLAGAIAAFDAAIERDPGLVVAYFNRAEAKTRAGRDGEAVADYTEALRLDPGFAPALAGRGRALSRLGQTRAGEEDLRRAAELGFPVGPGAAR